MTTRRIRTRVPARARIHRGNQLEARGEDGRPSDPRDGNMPVLERLAQGLEHIPIELGQLVEKQDPIVGHRHLPR